MTSVGSLCTGYAGLDEAVDEVLGGTTLAWYSEIDRDACGLLQRLYPGVTNLGDLKIIDWSLVPRVDVLTAGYPCQPFSYSGRRRGTDDPRHLWPFIKDAIRVLRPRLVVLENVAGHVSLGLDTVQGDLAEVGFDAEWGTLRASDVGACHRRDRVWIVAAYSGDRTADGQWTRPQPRPRGAAPADTSSDAGGRGTGAPLGAEEPAGRRAPHEGHGAVVVREAVADPDGQRLQERSERAPGRDVVRRGGPVRADADGRAPIAPDAPHVGRERGGGHGDGGLDLRTAVANAYGMAGSTPRAREGRSRPLDRSGPLERAERLPGVAWGEYEPAIRRHELVLGRPHPAPRLTTGGLSPMFVEWMMMLEDGRVTRAEISKTAALRILGNGVVPAQAVCALGQLLDRLEAA